MTAIYIRLCSNILLVNSSKHRYVFQIQTNFGIHIKFAETFNPYASYCNSSFCRREQV